MGMPPLKMMWRRVVVCSGLLLLISTYLLLVNRRKVEYKQVTNGETIVTADPKREQPEKPQEGSRESAASRVAGILPARDPEIDISALEKIDRLNQQCKRRENIFYLKIHKTGSSTMTMMMYRFILRHNLSALLVNISPMDKTIEEVQMHPPPDVNPPCQFNLFAEHYYYKDDDVAKMMPKDTAHIATIRHPLSHLRASMIEFNHMSKFEAGSDPVQTYLQDIYRWGPNGLGKTKSLQMEEFGVAKDKLDDMDAVRERIQFIKKTYTQVLVAEYFDESLLLAKRKLCWETEDIIYLMLRKRNYKHKTNIFGWSLEQAHRNFSKADYIMYDYFTDLLFKDIRQEANFWDELERYRQIKMQLADFCEAVFTTVLANRSSVYSIAEDDHNYLFVNATPWGRPFHIHAIECLMMSLDTTVLNNCIKVLEYPELCTSPKITRVFGREDAWAGTHIVWKPPESNTLHIQERYCTEIHPKFKMPLAILTHRKAYMMSQLKVE